MTKILLVEDDKSLREIYGVRLLAEGYDIVSAGDGEDALAMAIKERPQLIISDVMMPKISGFDMLDILRSTTETRDIKVIMMTALSSEDQRQRGEQLGADRYLVKSQVGIEDVVRMVHEVLEDTSGESAPQLAQATPAATPAPEPSLPADAPADSTTTDAATTAPGNDGAGPLPPQPSESTLPQPTAPFSSPRPANLGERVVQPLEDSSIAAPVEPSAPIADTTPSTALDNDAELPSTTPEESAQLANELQATPDPIASTQVDDPINSDTAISADDSTAPFTPNPLPTQDTATPAFDTPAESPIAPAPDYSQQLQSADDNLQPQTPPANPGTPNL